MTSLIFPDINVWLALNFEKHIHNEAAVRWYSTIDPVPELIFCRHTQLGLFRLLTNEVVLRQDVLNQQQCWEIYDRWIDSGLAILVAEPLHIDPSLRSATSTPMRSPKAWADAYLAAFAEASGLTLVTFDKALAGKAPGALLLQ